ncbi:MAG: ACP S-malonyltransferase [Parasporobacterium sp.]|nr:ACP S-malonyltransferase [Parasporobacterium sp.]
MGKIVFVFAGQGAQAPGMGKGFYESSEAARAVFDAADHIRPGTSRMCFDGTEEELQETRNTQPCLFTVEMAIAAALREAGIQADMTAGFSLGELSALTYAGVMSLEDGLQAVMKRGELMQEASLAHETSMAAIIKLSNDEIRTICSEFEHVYPVNFNCPGQTSVSGDAQEMLVFADRVKDAGGRARFLKVSGAFHSPYMKTAAEGFGAVLDGITLSEPSVPVYSNCTANPYTKEIRDTLVSQIDHPVQWEVIIRNMIAEGADTFVEIGPGKTLTGLIKRINGDVKLYNVAVPEDLEALVR